jgi:hypothetical protein
MNYDAYAAETASNSLGFGYVPSSSRSRGKRAVIPAAGIGNIPPDHYAVQVHSRIRKHRLPGLSSLVGSPTLSRFVPCAPPAPFSRYMARVVQF